jgi:hypothetical protein
MSFTSANIPSPNLLWQFESSNVDSVTSLAPLASNNSTISYNSLGKYYSSIVINTNNAAGVPASYLKYALAAVPSITVTCWIKPFSVSSTNQVVWGISDSTGTVLNWLQFIVSLSTITVYGNNPTGGTPLLTVQMGTVPVQNGVWYHTALTMRSSGAVYVYFNGVEIGPLQQYSAGTPNGVFRQLWSTWTASSLVVSSNTRYPGTNSGAWCEYDDLRVFNSVLTSSQIQTIYSQAGNSSIGTISRFFGGAGPSQFSIVTPGSVLAYSYLFSTVNMFGQSVGVDNGSNVYFGFQTAVLSATMFPNSLQKVPDPYYSFFPTGGNNGAILLKYNKLGKLVGMMKTSPSNQSILAIRTDSGSNTYVTVSGPIGGAWNAYDIDGSNPNLNAQSVPSQTNILKYSPAGKLIGWGGGMLGSAGLISSVALDSGSNVFICGYYRNAATSSIYNIGATNTVGGTLPSSVTPATAGAGGFWPTLFKWSPGGTFLGYSIIRGQNTNAACASAGSSPTLSPDNSGNMYWGGIIGSNVYCNVNSISTTEPTTNSYSLNTTQASATPTINGSNAFVIQFGPSGSVIKFVEIGYGPNSSGGRTTSATGIGVSSSGNVYVNGNFSGTGNFLNFGLADPKTGSFLSASSVSSVSTITPGSAYLLCYNSSGVVQSVTQHMADTIQLTPAPFIIDKNDSMYQFFSYGNVTFTLYNLGQTSSGITVPLPGIVNNYCLVKYNSAGNVVGFSVINGTNANLPFNMAVDPSGVYLNCRFINATGGIANVNAISSSVSFFANLPTITGQGAAMIKWSL